MAYIHEKLAGTLIGTALTSISISGEFTVLLHQVSQNCEPSISIYLNVWFILS